MANPRLEEIIKDLESRIREEYNDMDHYGRLAQELVNLGYVDAADMVQSIMIDEANHARILTRVVSHLKSARPGEPMHTSPISGRPLGFSIGPITWIAEARRMKKKIERRTKGIRERFEEKPE